MNACYRCGKTPVAKRLDGRVYLTCDCKMLPETEKRLADAEILQVQPAVIPVPPMAINMLAQILLESLNEQPTHPTAQEPQS